MIDYYTRIAPVAAAAPARPPADAEALPRRRRGPVLLREAVPVAPARLGARPRRSRAERARRSTSASPTTCRRSSGWRTSPTSSCTRRCRCAEDIERPTMMVFDLDPGAPAAILECAQVGALAARDCSTSSGSSASRRPPGSKGLQVYVPLNTTGRPTTRPSRSRTRSRGCSRSSIPSSSSRSMKKDAAQREGARRLEPERRAQDDRLRLLAAGARAADRLDAGRPGTRSRPRSKQATPDAARVRGRRGARARRASTATCSSRC